MMLIVTTWFLSRLRERTSPRRMKVVACSISLIYLCYLMLLIGWTISWKYLWPDIYVIVIIMLLIGCLNTLWLYVVNIRQGMESSTRAKKYCIGAEIWGTSFPKVLWPFRRSVWVLNTRLGLLIGKMLWLRIASIINAEKAIWIKVKAHNGTRYLRGDHHGFHTQMRNLY